jgi:hypothetical protein
MSNGFRILELYGPPERLFDRTSASGEHCIISISKLSSSSSHPHDRRSPRDCDG